MTHHKIKSICYQNASRKILLQNENGPCPLLAVTNILLLRGNLDLPKSCIRDNNAVNTSDVITMLANYALSRTSSKENDHHDQNNQYLLNELMQILPNLQYGLDINPKFTNDVQGYEYTQGVATLFDLLGVDLVHGWLIDDPCHDCTNADNGHNNNNDDDHKELFDLIRDKSYNECIEIVIQSNEAESHYNQMMNQKNEEKDRQEVATGKNDDKKDESENDDKKDESENDDQEKEDENDDKEEKDENEQEKDKKDDENEQEKDKNDDENEQDETNDWVKVQSIDGEKMKQLQQTMKKGKLINDFLTNTSHQLTYYGIHKLQMKLQSENDLKVFFRNNHFSIITKFNDTLYLLMTDLGYVNNSTIIWERLDGIDGNTDYYDSFFQLHPANNDYCSDIHDVDYQLALQLSKETSNSNHVTVQEESKVDGGTRAILPPLPNQQSENTTSTHETGDDDQAYAYALQLQQQEEYKSELLARKLQKEEYENNQRTTRNNNTANNAQKSCVIS